MLGVSSALSTLGNRARLVPATRRAPGLDVGGEGSEHFLSGEVGATHNQAMAVSEQHVHAGLGAVVPHVCNHRAVEVGGADFLAAHRLEEGPRRLHVLLEGAELNPNLLDSPEPEPSQGRRHDNLHPGSTRADGSVVSKNGCEWPRCCKTQPAPQSA